MKFTWDKPSVFNLGDSAPGSWGGHCVNDEAHDDEGNSTVTSWADASKSRLIFARHAGWRRTSS